MKSRLRNLSLVILGLIGCSLGLLQASTQASNLAQHFLTPTLQGLISRSSVLPEDRAMLRYDHIAVIIAENKAYSEIIGSADAPHLTQLAKTYGLATEFYGVVHPSEANYIALLGGSTFGIHDDDAFYCKLNSQKPFCSKAKEPGYADHTISGPSLMTQLEQHHLTWKGYFEDIPHPGSDAVVAPSPARALYAAKHNGFMNFQSVQTDPQRAEKIVGLDQLAQDLKQGAFPNFSHIILNQCNEMHGLPECREVHDLIRTGDRAITTVVEQIMTSPFWVSKHNNAIVITFDEDDYFSTGIQGCCGYDPQSAANFGGGKIATIVITNHGPRGFIDATPYNHYSLLRTIEDAFGIHEYLNHANDAHLGVKPMTPLFKRS